MGHSGEVEIGCRRTDLNYPNFNSCSAINCKLRIIFIWNISEQFRYWFLSWREELCFYRNSLVRIFEGQYLNQVFRYDIPNGPAWLKQGNKNFGKSSQSL